MTHHLFGSHTNPLEMSRRTLVKLENKLHLAHSKEIQNAANEANDVPKVLATLIAEMIEADHYLNKWGVASQHDQLSSMFAVMTANTDATSTQFKTLIDGITNDYVKVLQELCRATEAMAKEEAPVHELQQKVEAKKAQQSDLDAAATKFNQDSAQFHTDTLNKYHAAALALTNHFVAFHEAQLAAFRKQAQTLLATPPMPVVAHPDGGIAVAVPAAQPQAVQQPQPVVQQQQQQQQPQPQPQPQYQQIQMEPATQPVVVQAAPQVQLAPVLVSNPSAGQYDQAPPPSSGTGTTDLFVPPGPIGATNVPAQPQPAAAAPQQQQQQ